MKRQEANRGVKRPKASFGFFSLLIFIFLNFQFFIFFFILISQCISHRTWNKVALHHTDTRTNTDVST